jgi:hypothetical protein
MVNRQLRYTLSAAAWVGVFFCALALLVSATAAASLASNQAPHRATTAPTAGPAATTDH